MKRTEVWLGGRLRRETQMASTGPAVFAPQGRLVPLWSRWVYDGEPITEEQARALLGY